MSFFDKFKSQSDIAKQEIVEVPWHVLSTMEQVDELLEESKSIPVAIFKHSTRCGVSRSVLKQWERDYNLKEEQLKLYFLDLLQYRNISNAISERLQVPHESPQLIVVKNGAAVHNDSHHYINASHLERFV